MKQGLVNVLRWSERYTKTDMVFLVKKAVWPVIGQVVASASTLVLALAFARLASKETYGTYKFILSIPTLFGIVLLPGLSTALWRSIAKNYDGDFYVVLNSKRKWALLFCIIGLCISTYYWIQGNILLGTGILLVCVFTALIDVLGLYGTILNAKYMLREATELFMLDRITTLSLTLAALYFLGNSLLTLIVATFASGIIIRYIFFKRITRQHLANNNISGDVLSYGKHLSFITVLSSFVADLDNLLVFHFLGPAPLAIYAFATAVPEQLKGPLTGIDQIIFSKFSQHSEKNIQDNIKRKFAVFGIAAVIIITLYWVAAPFIYKILFPQYSEAVFYSQIFSLSLLYIAVAPATIFLSAHGKIREQYIINITTACLQFTTMLIGIVYWGLLGLMISRIISRLFPHSLATYFLLVAKIKKADSM